MKTTTCILSAALLVVLCDSNKVSAQTYVSGGIYANTTWPFANSPYIVTADVVVFPGFTLTIEPGVEIKFDNSTSLEIRQATLIAEGTSAATITFTSNSGNPVAGIWEGIWINGTSTGTNFNHCLIEYATTGVDCNFIGFIKNSVFRNNDKGLDYAYFPIDSCVFTNNTTGIAHIQGSLTNCTLKQNITAIEDVYISMMNHCTLDSNTTAVTMMSHSQVMNSSFSYNTSGIRTQYGMGSKIESCVINYNSNFGVLLQTENDTVSNSVFYYNNVGLSLGAHFADGGSIVSNSEMKYNTTGISISGNFSIPSSVTQCVIENNATGITLGNTLVTITCNRICYNTSYNLAMAIPVNYNVSGNEWCTVDSNSTAALIYDGYDNITYGLVTFLPMDTLGCSPNTEVTSINELNDFSIYPNPASVSFTIRQNAAIKNAELKIFNAMGEIVYRDKTGNEVEHICRPNITPGYYVIQINKNDQASSRSLVIMK